MRLHIIAVGNKMPDWVKSGFSEYSTRLKPYFPVTLTEIPLAKRNKDPSDSELKKIKILEGEKIVKVIPPKSITIALDVAGKLLSTEAFAKQMDSLQQKTSIVNFLIGGPDGLSQECLAKADLKWSLSSLTLPHPLVRIILIEQLYRATSILKNHPYHRI